MNQAARLWGSSRSTRSHHQTWLDNVAADASHNGVGKATKRLLECGVQGPSLILVTGEDQLVLQPSQDTCSDRVRSVDYMIRRSPPASSASCLHWPEDALGSLQVNFRNNCPIGWLRGGGLAQHCNVHQHSCSVPVQYGLFRLSIWKGSWPCSWALGTARFMLDS